MENKQNHEREMFEKCLNIRLGIPKAILEFERINIILK